MSLESILKFGLRHRGKIQPDADTWHVLSQAAGTLNDLEAVAKKYAGLIRETKASTKLTAEGKAEALLLLNQQFHAELLPKKGGKGVVPRLRETVAALKGKLPAINASADSQADVLREIERRAAIRAMPAEQQMAVLKQASDSGDALTLGAFLNGASWMLPAIAPATLEHVRQKYTEAKDPAAAMEFNRYAEAAGVLDSAFAEVEEGIDSETLPQTTIAQRLQAQQA